MRLTPVGKLVLLIIAIGGAVGAWRWWSGRSGARAPGGLVGLFEPAKSNPNGVEIPILITAAKKDWVQDQVDRFNAENRGRWQVVPKPVPSREAMHAILEEKEQPVLWSPGSPIWPARLAEAWTEKHGDTLLDLSDANGYRVFLRSPLVFVTTRKRAAFLRPRLGGSEPWQALRRLSMGQDRAPWGAFRFSHADPLTSSSGMLTLGLVLSDYARRTRRGDLGKAAVSSEFMAYLKEMERGLLYDVPAEKGTTALTKAFLDDPDRYDVITAYEASVLEALPNNPELAVIYPNPTAVSEHAVSLLRGKWVTPEQREGAIAFLSLLGSKEALQSGLKYHFRPAQASGGLSLASELSKYAAQGFQESLVRGELPPYEALNAAAYQWRIHIAKKPPVNEK
jgi:hypothetical protein